MLEPISRHKFRHLLPEFTETVVSIPKLFHRSRAIVATTLLLLLNGNLTPPT